MRHQIQSMSQQNAELVDRSIVRKLLVTWFEVRPSRPRCLLGFSVFLLPYTPLLFCAIIAANCRSLSAIKLTNDVILVASQRPGRRSDDGPSASRRSHRVPTRVHAEEEGPGGAENRRRGPRLQRPRHGGGRAGEGRGSAGRGAVGQLPDRGYRGRSSRGGVVGPVASSDEGWGQRGVKEVVGGRWRWRGVKDGRRADDVRDCSIEKALRSGARQWRIRVSSLTDQNSSLSPFSTGQRSDAGCTSENASDVPGCIQARGRHQRQSVPGNGTTITQSSSSQCDTSPMLHTLCLLLSAPRPPRLAGQLATFCPSKRNPARILQTSPQSSSLPRSISSCTSNNNLLF